MQEYSLSNKGFYKAEPSLHVIQPIIISKQSTSFSCYYQPRVHPPTHSTYSCPTSSSSPCLSHSPPFILPENPPSLSPGLQAMKGLVHIFLVEAGHVAVHLLVVVPYVSLRASVRNRAKAERRREVIGMLKLRERNRRKHKRCPESMNTRGRKGEESCHLQNL